MVPPVIEGFVVDGPLPSAHPRVSRWSLGGEGGEAYVGGEALVERARHLPTWGPFAAIRIVDESNGPGVVVVPGRLAIPLPKLARRLTPGARVALAWHVAAQIAQLHENGAAHGAIDGQSVGLDAAGRLHVRPALHLELDGDQTATAQAHDCILLGRMFATLGLDETRDKNVALVLQGLSGARTRLAPGWAVRQALMAILVRHPEWETELVDELGDAFRFDAVDDVEPLPISREPRAEPEDEVSLDADGISVDLATPPSAEGPWAAFPVAEEDLPYDADEVTEDFPRAAEPTEPPGRKAPPGGPPRQPEPPAPPEPEEEPGVPVPETPPQLPDEDPEGVPEQEEPVRDPDEVPEQEPVEEPREDPREQPDGRLDAATVEEEDEPSFDVLDLVPPDAPEVSLIGVGRTSELEFSLLETPNLDTGSGWVDLVAVPAEVEASTAVQAEVVETVDVAALVASVAAAVDELPPVDDRWPVDTPDEPTPVVLQQKPIVAADPVVPPKPVSEPPPAVEPKPVAEPDWDVESETVIAPRPVAPKPVAPKETAAPKRGDVPEPPVRRTPSRDEPRTSDGAKWMDVRGVTNDSGRDAELGSGKWTEPARPLEELARELPHSPTRSMEIPESGGGGWVALVIAGLVVGVFGVAVFGFVRAEQKAPAAAPVHAALRTVPDGAEVLIDGRTVGVAPVDIALPKAGTNVEVCAVWAGDRHCATLGRAQLEGGYTFERPAR